MADVWIGYTTVLETVMARMHSLCLEDRDRYANHARVSCVGKYQTLHLQDKICPDGDGITLISSR